MKGRAPRLTTATDRAEEDLADTLKAWARRHRRIQAGERARLVERASRNMYAAWFEWLDDRSRARGRRRRNPGTGMATTTISAVDAIYRKAYGVPR